MKKLILLFLALPLLLTNCVRDEPDSPSTVTTTYKGIFTQESTTTTPQQKTALLVVTENSATDWSMSFEIQEIGAAPQVFATTRTNTKIEFFNQGFFGANVNGKGDILANGEQIQFFLSSTDPAATSVGTFVGTKQ